METVGVDDSLKDFHYKGEWEIEDERYYSTYGYAYVINDLGEKLMMQETRNNP